MKKKIVVSALAIACTVAFNLHAFASFHKEANYPDSKTIKAAHRDFPQAGEIIWEDDGPNFIAQFDLFERKVMAVYNHKGMLISTMIFSDDAKYIPFGIQMSLIQKYPRYSPQFMREYITSQEHIYYFILKEQRGNQVNWLWIKTNNNKTFTVIQKLRQTV